MSTDCWIVRRLTLRDGTEVIPTRAGKNRAPSRRLQKSSAASVVVVDERSSTRVSHASSSQASNSLVPSDAINARDHSGRRIPSAEAARKRPSSVSASIVSIRTVE